MNNSSIDIFKTPFRKLMQSMIKTPTKPIPSKTVQSFNIAYPTAANAIQFNPLPGPGTYNPSKPKRNNKINFSASQRQPLISKQNSKLGPGSFEPKKISATSVKIGTSKRPPLAIPTSAPLPGKYEYQSKIIESQGTNNSLFYQDITKLYILTYQFTVLFSKEAPTIQLLKKFIQGLAQESIIQKKKVHHLNNVIQLLIYIFYQWHLNFDLNEQFKLIQQYLFPKSQRHDFTKQKRGIPGPIYEIEVKPQTPQYSFGKCKR